MKQQSYLQFFLAICLPLLEWSSARVKQSKKKLLSMFKAFVASALESEDPVSWMKCVSADDLVIPDSGPIPITMCIDPNFPFTNDENYTHVMWRTVKPTRQQSDFGPKEWVTEDWQMTGFQETGKNCTLSNNETGNLIVSNVPVPEDFSGKLHYKSMLGTRSGTFPFSYPATPLPVSFH